jgi:predicted metallopeptidase
MIYEFDPELQKKAEEISRFLFPNIKIENVKCYRSYGTSSKRIIARCHALGKLMQKAMSRQAFYVLEFLSERFDKLDEEEKTKVVIHELMHIPKCFGGGFKHHNIVTDKSVDLHYKTYKSKKEQIENESFFKI